MSQVVLATAGYDHTIRFWEAPTGVCRNTLHHPDSQVNRIEITNDKRQIACAGNPSVRLFDVSGASAAALSVYNGHSNNVTSVWFDKDAKWMYTSSEDGFLKIWDVRAPTCQREYDSGVH